VFGDPTAPRFVFWEKKLRATPSGPDALTFDLLSIWGKIRAGLGAVGIVKGGPMPGEAAQGLLAASCLVASWRSAQRACMQQQLPGVVSKRQCSACLVHGSNRQAQLAHRRAGVGWWLLRIHECMPSSVRSSGHSLGCMQMLHTQLSAQPK
jgi:hypothetical protein